MTDTAAPAPAANPALANTDPGKAQQPPAAQAEPQAPPAPKPGDVGTPEWLNPRLEQKARAARADLLKEIGVDDPEALKKLVAESRARADAEKTASEKLAASEKARERAEQTAETYRAALAVRAEAEFAKLTEPQRAFVEKTAGADPAKRIAAIEDVRALVSAAPPPPAAPPAAPPAPPPAPEAKRVVLPAPASTAPGGAPPGGHPPPPRDLLAELEHHDRTNPVYAGAFYAQHRAEITRLRAQKTAASASQ